MSHKSFGQPWVPSNGSEGCWFTETYCEHCIHEKFVHTNSHDDSKCDILSLSFLNWPDPLPEWIYDENGEPKCIQHKHWDWGRGDDEDGWNEPPIISPDENNPNQLCLPFLFDELEIKQHEQEVSTTD